MCQRQDTPSGRGVSGMYLGGTDLGLLPRDFNRPRSVSLHDEENGMVRTGLVEWRLHRETKIGKTERHWSIYGSRRSSIDKDKRLWRTHPCEGTGGTFICVNIQPPGMRTEKNLNHRLAVDSAGLGIRVRARKGSRCAHAAIPILIGIRGWVYSVALATHCIPIHKRISASRDRDHASRSSDILDRVDQKIEVLESTDSARRVFLPSPLVLAKNTIR
ncbi:hypothetical protein B0H10DRAFT_2192558 [Mycena sp. CBHHK59/15]|nr:hypothetical protein B0H10DRAFT_2192558 [Mycena sp. CBHHK59/15]